MDGAEGAVEREFADKELVLEVLRKKLIRESKDSESDGEVEVGAIFGEVGRGKVDSDAFVGEGEARGGESAFNAFAGFGDGFIGHADDIEGGEAFVHVALDFYDTAFVSVEDGRVNFGYHRLMIEEKKKNRKRGSTGKRVAF